MLWIRYKHREAQGFGTLEGEVITPCKGDLFGENVPHGETIPLTDATLLMPCLPGKMPALWNNYYALAKEKELVIPDTPLYLLKAPGSYTGPDTVIKHPATYSGDVFYEGELGIVIGLKASGVTPEDAGKHIFGYTCINDVTAFGLLKDYPGFDQWTRAKGFDTFGVFGPAIATDTDISRAEVVTRVDGVEKQRYPIADMIMPPEQIVSKLSENMTLMPGDVICCGTSQGLGPMPRGCRVEVEIKGIGVLSNKYE